LFILVILKILNMLDKKLLNSRIIIKEKIDAPVILVEKEKNDRLLFFKKHGKKITYLDKVLTKLYDFPINYFLKNRNIINKGLTYKFHYLYNEKPSKIEYPIDQKIVLTDIFKKKSNDSFCVFEESDFFKQNLIVDSKLNEDLFRKVKQLNHYGYSTFVNNLNSSYKSNLNNLDANSIEVIIVDNNDKLLKKFTHNFNRNQEVRSTNDKNILVIKELF
jgi:hypothetical protein